MGKVTPTQIRNFYDQISHFTQPEELFGALGTTQAQQLSQLEIAFKSLIKLYHPDQYAKQPEELANVTEIVKIINGLKQHATIKIKASVYGEMNPGDNRNVITTSRHEYFVTEYLVEGSHADIYHGFYLDPGDKAQPKKEVVIKIIADRSRNDLVRQEVAFYQTLTHFCFPNYLEDFCTSDGKHAIVLSYIAGGYDLIELKRRYRQQYYTPGLPQEHLVWILDRYLSALGLLHEKGILHGNIQPDNLIVQPKNHNGLLIDFLHCRINPAPDEVMQEID
jgi:serine/threonine protein kinase